MWSQLMLLHRIICDDVLVTTCHRKKFFSDDFGILRRHFAVAKNLDCSSEMLVIIYPKKEIVIFLDPVNDQLHNEIRQTILM